MTKWKEEIRQRLANLKLAPTCEAEIVEELAQHLEDRYEEFLSVGVTEEQAYRAALAELNESDLLMGELRRLERPIAAEPIVLGANRKGNMIADLWQDIRYAVRMMRKNPGCTSIAVITLTLGIGANTALFSFADAVLFRPLPFANPERLVLVKGAAGTLVDMGFDQPEKFMQWNRTVESLEYMAAYDSGRANLADDRVPERIQVMRVSADFFPMLGVNPMKGRWFGQDEQQQGKNRVLILSHAFWQSRYGGDAEILEKVVHLNGESFQVIGVMPSKLPPLEYPAHFETRYVSHNGGIRWNCAWVNVSITCAGEYVGLEEIDNGIWNVYFGPLKLGRLSEEKMRIEDAYGSLWRHRKKQKL